MTTAEAMFRVRVAWAALRWALALAIMPSEFRATASWALEAQTKAYQEALRQITERRRRERAPWN